MTSAVASIVSSLISAIVAIVVCLITQKTANNKVLNQLETQTQILQVRLDDMSSKVDKHNHLDARLIKVEEHIKILEARAMTDA